MKVTTKSLTQAALFTALIAILAQIQIPTPPIPFSFTVFAVVLTGAVLRPRQAFLSVLAYLLLGAFGLPVFAGMQGGVGVLFGLTGGFKLSYPLMALLVSVLGSIHKEGDRPIAHTIRLSIGMLLALLLCYTMGTLWFMAAGDQPLNTALSACVIPFIPFDCLKLVLAVAGAAALERIPALKHA